MCKTEKLWSYQRRAGLQSERLCWCSQPSHHQNCVVCSWYGTEWEENQRHGADGGTRLSWGSVWLLRLTSKQKWGGFPLIFATALTALLIKLMIVLVVIIFAIVVIVVLVIVVVFILIWHSYSTSISTKSIYIIDLKKSKYTLFK